MALQMNFLRDVATRCVERLNNAGYATTPSSDEQAIHTYVRVRHRRVRSMPRKVHKAAYTVPPHLAVGEQLFLAKVAAGDNLWPHQSRKIGNDADEDGMLNDYGIQHFHLGTLPDARRPHLFAGTKELLFAIVRDADFYAIGIYDHNSWSRQSVVDIVHQTWPQLTSTYTIRGVAGLPQTYTDEEAKQYRAANINIPQLRQDGVVQIGMGGGINAAGTSVRARRETDKLIVHVEGLQAAVAAALASAVTSGVLTAGTSVRVIWVGEKIFAVPDPPVCKVDLTGRLMIPPL